MSDHDYKALYEDMCKAAEAAQGTLMRRIEELTSERAAARADAEPLRVAATEALDWLDRFGKDAPIQFGGEAEVAERLRDALAAGADTVAGEANEALAEENQRIGFELASHLSARTGIPESELLESADGTDSADAVDFALAMAHHVGDVKKEQAVHEFTRLILHGDDDHRGWLQDAAKQFIEEGTVPPPRGKNAVPAPVGAPIPMVLYCPRCHVQHVDQDDATGNWATTRHHRKHLCKESDAGCGFVFQPANVHTVGVAELPDARAIAARQGA